MNRRILGVCIFMSMAIQLAAQSFNVDVNRATGSGTGVPANSFGAAAGQTGVWNGILPGSSGTFGLVDLGGAATAASLTRSGSGSGSADSVSGASVDYGRLMWDYGNAFQVNQQVVYTINGLLPGLYRAWVYAALPGASGTYQSQFGTEFHINYVNVTVNNTSVGGSSTTGAVTPNVFTPGVTHVEVPFSIPAGGSLKLSSATDLGVSLSYAALNGFQLVRYTGSRLYVRAGAFGGANNGLDWANAFRDLQSALALARVSNGQITEIWVASGTYKPTSTTNRSATFKLVDGVKLYGGFAGSENQLSSRNPLLNVTTLSGNLTGLMTQDSHHVVTADGVSSTTVIDGFNIVDGNADGASLNYGAGLVATNGVPQIKNCTFTSHRANYGGAVAILCNNGYIGIAQVENCIFRNNDAGVEGGAIYFDGEDGFVDARMNVLNCSLVGNRSFNNDGGAIMFNGDGAVSNSRLIGNYSVFASGGAIESKNTDTVVQISNCTFLANYCIGSGGALRVLTGSTMSVRNSILWGNYDSSLFPTAGVISSQVAGQPTVNYCCIENPFGSVYTGTANIATFPLFVDIDGLDGILGNDDDNLRLQQLSPCLDAGNNFDVFFDATDMDGDNITFEIAPFDLARLPRALDGNGDVVANVDMGCYEFQPNGFFPTLPGSGEDFFMFSGIGSVVNVVGNDIWMPTFGNILKIRLTTPQGLFVGRQYILAAQLILTGTPFPTLNGFPELHLNDQGGFILTQNLTPTAPVDFQYPTPPNLGGFTAIFQGIAIEPMAQNGIFAATDAHQFIF